MSALSDANARVKATRETYEAAQRQLATYAEQYRQVSVRRLVAAGAAGCAVRPMAVPS